MKHFITLCTYICLFAVSLSAQKVGLVFSGGGANAIAHVGVLKALEKDSIPIDYICGTSLGALIGGMYASGLSPQQIESFVLSEDFKNMAYGKIDDKYIFYFKKPDANAGWLSIKLALDSSIETSLPTNFISSVPIDFSMMEVTAQASNVAGYSFDRLFVPFRCVAADIEAKKSVIFSKGDLGTAIRASLAYPFYLKPINIDNKLLYDGGIYNNFPSDVMYHDFFPDIIIGSNVSSNEPPPDEDNIVSQMKTMLLTKTNFDVVCQNGIIIEPNTGLTTTFNFDNIQPLIDSGYAATIRQLPYIKASIQRRSTPDSIAVKRKNFNAKKKELLFENITVSGLNKVQSQYIKNSLGKTNTIIKPEKLKREYFKLASDEKIKSLFPVAVSSENENHFTLNLQVKKEKEFTAELGGNFSNRPISEGFVGVKYNYINRTANSVYANAYFGKLYSSGLLGARIDVPTKTPFYFEPVFTINKWDFFKSSNEFVTDKKPSFLVQYEQSIIGNLGVPISNTGKIVGGSGYAWLTDEYYQTDLFTQKDTADRTDFNLYTAHLYYENNSLNRKQYATSGTNFLLKVRYIHGEEYYEFGSTSLDTSNYRRLHEWVQFKLRIENYFESKTIYKLGYLFEGVYSTQTLFSNYTSSLLTAPAFQPLPESKTLFQEKYRAHKFFGIGLKNVFAIYKFLDLRIEGYLYQPYQQIIRIQGLNAGYTSPFSRRFLIGTAALVMNTPIGPASISTNYYYREDEPFTFLFHFGYILFNKRVTD